MTIQEQINAVNCGAKASLGTGLAGCKMDRKRVTALGLLRKGYVFNEEVTKELLVELQKSGDLVMLQGVVSFVDNTAEDNIVTRDGSGIKVVAGKNPYEYAATFDNGINFHKALTSLSSYEGWDMILFDGDNTLFGTETKNGLFKGYTLGMFENGKYTGSDGATTASQTVTFQLINRMEFDLYAAWIANDKLDFFYSDLKGVNETIFKALPVAVGATKIAVSVFLLDKTHPVKGLLPAEFKVVKNGAEITPSAATYNDATGIYELTIPAAVAADIYNVSLNGVVEVVLGDLYKSNTATVVVA